jgi:hypothetical protein
VFYATSDPIRPKYRIVDLAIYVDLIGHPSLFPGNPPSMSLFVSVSLDLSTTYPSLSFKYAPSLHLQAALPLVFLYFLSDSLVHNTRLRFSPPCFTSPSTILSPIKVSDHVPTHVNIASSPRTKSRMSFDSYYSPPYPNEHSPLLFMSSKVLHCVLSYPSLALMSFSLTRSSSVAVKTRSR